MSRKAAIRKICFAEAQDTPGGSSMSTWWKQSSQIGQVLYHGRDGHATKPSWHGRLARECLLNARTAGRHNECFPDVYDSRTTAQRKGAKSSSPSRPSVFGVASKLLRGAKANAVIR